MKRLLLSAAISAIISGALLTTSSHALSYSQTDDEYRALCRLHLSQDEQEEFLINYECSDEHQDEVISVGQQIGTSNIDNISSPVSVLTSTDIENRNQNYVSELLRALPGVSVNRSGPGGALTQIRMRGSEASHVLVIIDGVEMANPTAGEFDFSGIRASNIVKIEVLRGEQSALYGSDAVGGVINIITNAGTRQKFWQANVEAGSFGTYSGQFNGAVPIGDATLTLGVGGLTTNGYDISGLSGEKDGSKSRSYDFGLNNVNAGGINISAKYTNSHLDTEFDEDSDFNGRLDNTDAYSLIDTESARITGQFELGSLENVITLSGHNIQTDSRGGFASISDGTRRKASWAIKETFGEHAITVLGEAETESYEITPSFAFQATKPSNTNKALAGDYRYTGDAISFTASARHDFNGRFDDAFTWKLGGTYVFDSFGGRVRASVGTGVKNPSLIELFGFYPESNFMGNPDLTPEESFGFNVGYTHDFDLAGGDLELSADYFHADLEDEIFTDFSSFPFLARNRATDSKREGVELSADWNNGGDVSFYGSATFLDAKENGVEEIRRPEFLASMTATWNAMEDLSFTGSIDHTGSQLDTDFATFSPVKLDAFTLVGLNAAYNVNDVVTLTLRGENILDEDYQEVVGYASQGRGVFAGLNVRFD